MVTELRFTMRIFIVEDEALIAMEFEHRLRELGHEVCGHALRGEQALAMIPGAKPDLVLMDVNLGPGLSGLDVAERLDPLGLRIIFLSAYSDAELQQRALRGRSFHYLVKPFRSDALQAAISAVTV